MICLGNVLVRPLVAAPRIVAAQPSLAHRDERLAIHCQRVRHDQIPPAAVRGLHDESPRQRRKRDRSRIRRTEVQLRCDVLPQHVASILAHRELVRGSGEIRPPIVELAVGDLLAVLERRKELRQAPILPVVSSHHARGEQRPVEQPAIRREHPQIAHHRAASACSANRT